MDDEPEWARDLPIPALLRGARRAYGRRMRAALAAAGIGPVPRSGLWVLGALRVAGGTAAVAPIVRDLGLDAAGAGELLRALATLGLVRRVEADEPTFTLTERGAQAAALQADARVAVDADLRACVGEADVAALRRALAALCSIAD